MSEIYYADEREFITWAVSIGATRIKVGDIELTVPPKTPALAQPEVPTDPIKKAEELARIKYWSA